MLLWSVFFWHLYIFRSNMSPVTSGWNQALQNWGFKAIFWFRNMCFFLGVQVPKNQPFYKGFGNHTVLYLQQAGCDTFPRISRRICLGLSYMGYPQVTIGFNTIIVNILIRDDLGGIPILGNSPFVLRLKHIFCSGKHFLMVESCYIQGFRCLNRWWLNHVLVSFSGSQPRCVAGHIPIFCALVCRPWASRWKWTARWRNSACATTTSAKRVLRRLEMDGRGQGGTYFDGLNPRYVVMSRFTGIYHVFTGIYHGVTGIYHILPWCYWDLPWICQWGTSLSTGGLPSSFPSTNML